MAVAAIAAVVAVVAVAANVLTAICVLDNSHYQNIY